MNKLEAKLKKNKKTSALNNSMAKNNSIMSADATRKKPMFIQGVAKKKKTLIKPMAEGLNTSFNNMSPLISGSQNGDNLNKSF